MVVDDPAAIGDVLQAGIHVVLLVDPHDRPVTRPDFGPGRLAILVGRVDDPLVQAAADQMAAELFGSPDPPG